MVPAGAASLPKALMRKMAAIITRPANGSAEVEAEEFWKVMMDSFDDEVEAETEDSVLAPSAHSAAGAEVARRAEQFPVHRASARPWLVWTE